jgi:hypothetical protein
MATTKSTQATKVDAIPRQELSVRESRGRVRTVRFDYTQVALGAIADEIELCDLPAGARILAGLSYVRTGVGTASETYSLGTRAHVNAQTGATIAQSAARFAAGVAANATPAFNTLAAVAGAMALDTDTVLGTARVYVTIAGAGAAAGQAWSGEISFIVD